MGERLEVAREILEAARRELDRGRALRDSLLIRNACDKAFLAVVQAVNDFARLKAGVVPANHAERRKLLRAVGREDLRAEYSDLMTDLHDDAFYSGMIDEPTIEAAFRKAEGFLRKVAELEGSGA